MVKLSPSIALLAAAAAIGSVAAADKAAAPALVEREDLSHLFDARASGLRKRHASLARTVNAKRQAAGGSLPFSGTVPAPGGTSLNGKPYPAPDGGVTLKKSTLPQAWIDRYQQKKKAGAIPDLPHSTLDPNTGVPKYPAGTDLSKICSWSITNCNDGDIWLAPQGYTAITFDDGPTQYSADLISFLTDNKQASTHFLIGTSILNMPEGMRALASHNLAHLGVHTFSHTLQTSKTDLQIVADLGWTMQLIYEWTGLVPMYWRAPEGDVDARVRAIAKEVFGLQHTSWSNDADDWCLKDGGGTENSIASCRGKTFDSVVAEYKSWASNSSLPGTNTLMHETKDQTVAAFKQYYGFLQKSKYKTGSVASIMNAPWYQNQMAPTDTPEKVSSILPTREPMDFTDGGLHPVGSSGGAALGAFSTLASVSGSGSSSAAGTSTGSNASAGTNSGSGAGTGTSSGSTKAGVSSTSGAAPLSLGALQAAGAIIAALAAALVAAL